MTECLECGAEDGDWHCAGCSWEPCPYCGHPLADCPCRPPLDDRLIWTGFFPWLEAYLEFDFFERPVGSAWVACGFAETDSQPDLGRLLRECAWDREAKRFVRRHAIRGEPERG